MSTKPKPQRCFECGNDPTPCTGTRYVTMKNGMQYCSWCKHYCSVFLEPEKFQLDLKGLFENYLTVKE